MPAKHLKYLWSRDGHRTFDYPIQAIQRALARRDIGAYNNDQPITRAAARVCATLKLMRRFADISSAAYLAPIMQVTEQRLFPVCYYAETIVYAMDVWPTKYELWENFFRRHKMRIAFITARQSADRMRSRVPALDAIWLPEAIEIENYRGDKPLAHRPIDVLEMGRRYAPYHDIITPHCSELGYVHRYSETVTSLIFPDFDDLVRGLNDSKISICFPSSMTHPDRSGNVETMTLRYLETIASRCIPLGHCPAEMVDLFGYNPVVEADVNDPAGQIDDILANLSVYDALLERNYQRIIEIATWDVRADELLGHLRDRGYDTSGDN